MSTSNNSLNTNQLPISLDVNFNEQGFENILLLYLRRIANAVNTKENGFYLLQETASFERWYQLDDPVNNPLANPQQTRNGYRLTLDLWYLNNSTNIPGGMTTTNIVLSSSTQPMNIDGYLYPVQGFGGAIDTTFTSYFLNDPQIYVRYTNSTNTISITNNTANALTWCVWVMEYLKS